MPQSLLQPLSRTEVASAAVTTTGQSATITLPQAREYTWILDVTAISGTNPTLDVAIQISPQSPGTPVNWYNALAFRQFLGVTGVDILKNTPAALDNAGSEYLAYKSGTTPGPIAVNLPLTRKIRFSWVIGGTAAPTYTFAIFGIYDPKGGQQI